MSLSLCLEEIVNEEQTPDSRELLLQAHASIAQMSKLISDLLSYAHVGNGDLRKVSCDCNAALIKAIASVHAMAGGIGAEITHDHLPIIKADETLIIQVFQNLLENSLKYSTGSPRIHIGAQESEQECLFSVADHGIGIPGDRLEDVFKPFTRLHAAEYPGRGLGLATCRRAIERHHGRIWAKSEPGMGSTFFFTIPK
jgi:signal transduction histidine kinase